MKRSSLSVVLLIAACASPVEVLESTTVEVGPEGGTAKSADGVFSVSIGAGALLTEETIVIRTDRTAALDDQISLRYELAPGREMDVPARIAFVGPGVTGATIARVQGALVERIGGVFEEGALVLEVERIAQETYIVVAPPVPVTSFPCEETVLPVGPAPVAVTRLPGASGQADFVAILHDDAPDALLEVRNPLQSAATRSIVYAGEQARAVHGFEYEPGRPALAVVTSNALNGARVYVYEWIGGELVPHDGTTSPGAPLAGDCPAWDCAGPMQADSCLLRIEFQTRVTLDAADVDGDGKADLALASNSDLPLLVYRSSEAPAGALYDASCRCTRHAQAPTAFALLQLGGSEPASTPQIDLAMAAPGGAFVDYGTQNGLECGQPSRVGALLPVRDLVRGRFQCLGASCATHDDLVYVAARSLGGGSFDDPGALHVIHGAPIDHSQVAQPYIELTARSLPGEEEPRDPRAAAAGDVDGDGNDDLAVLFLSSDEVHVWVNTASGLVEPDNGANLASCGASAVACMSLDDLALADFDADGADEIAVVCNAAGGATLRRYRMVTTP